MSAKSESKRADTAPAALAGNPRHRRPGDGTATVPGPTQSDGLDSQVHQKRIAQ